MEKTARYKQFNTKLQFSAGGSVFFAIKEPGTLLGIVVDEKITEMEKIVHAITEENITLGSVLVARHWSEGKRAVFPYLFTMNVVRLKQKLEGMGYELLDPVEWYIDQRG